MKVDPLSIKIDQRKRDRRRDAWDRDLGYSPQKLPAPDVNITPVYVFALFFIAILVLSA